MFICCQCAFVVVIVIFHITVWKVQRIRLEKCVINMRTIKKGHKQTQKFAQQTESTCTEKCTDRPLFTTAKYEESKYSFVKRTHILLLNGVVCVYMAYYVQSFRCKRVKNHSVSKSASHFIEFRASVNLLFDQIPIFFILLLFFSFSSLLCRLIVCVCVCFPSNSHSQCLTNFVFFSLCLISGSYICVWDMCSSLHSHIIWRSCVHNLPHEK